MEIRDQRHANVSKQTTLLADVDDVQPNGAAYITRVVNVFHREMKTIENGTFILGECNKNKSICIRMLYEQSKQITPASVAQ